MSEPDQPPTLDDLTTLLEEGTHEETVAYLDRLGAADAETRKRTLRAIRDAAAEQLRSFEELTRPLATFLTDDDRAVRLTAAKLFVTLAQSEPRAVLPIVDALADRLGDDGEFYYVRARSAEALGYVALEHPEEVTSPEILADLRVGLSFDEPEVKEKLAKAQEFVAIAYPKRLRHQVSSLAEHLADEDELVRYHLTTTLVAIGCAYPDKLAEATDELTKRLADDNPQVRGRAAEALGVFARGADDTASFPEVALEALADDEEAFVSERVRFALDSDDATRSERFSEDIGSVDGVRRTTNAAVEEITSPAGDGECPHCGLVLPENGPPMCPRCGAPR